MKEKFLRRILQTPIVISLFGALVLAGGFAPALAQTGGKVENYKAQMTVDFNRPWTMILPDPDKIDWNNLQDRPGYRYRGMLPSHQRFYDYIQAKRHSPTPLNWMDKAMIHTLQTIRRWPEAPIPSPAALAYMRYLRGLNRIDLNLSEAIMLSEIWGQGLIPTDVPPNASFQPMVEYLQSGPFQPRNLWERCFGRADDYLDWTVAAIFDTRVPGSFSFPTPPIDGVQIGYSISGARITDSKESKATIGYQAGRGENGEMDTKGSLRLWGTVRTSGVHQTLFSAYVRAGTNSKVIERRISDKITVGVPISGGYTFDLSVPIPELPPPPEQGYAPGNYWISIQTVSGTLGQPDYKVHAMVDISGWLRRPDELTRKNEVTDWRAEVEKTLKKLGYEETAEGGKLRRMREARAAGPAAWKAYTNEQFAFFNANKNDKDRFYECVQQAMENGGPAWDAYVQTESCGGLRVPQSSTGGVAGQPAGQVPPVSPGGGTLQGGAQPQGKTPPAGGTGGATQTAPPGENRPAGGGATGGTAAPGSGGGTTAAAGADRIAGTWNWVNGQTMIVYTNGTFDKILDGKRFNGGRWVNLGGSQFRFTHETGGYIDTLTLSADGKSFDGTNNEGYHLTGSKKNGGGAVQSGAQPQENPNPSGGGAVQKPIPQAWNLVETQTKIIPDTNYPGCRWEGGPSALTATKEWIGVTDGGHYGMKAVYSWQGIPASLAPGQVFQPTVAIRQLANNSGSGCWLKIYMNMVGGNETDGPDTTTSWREGIVAHQGGNIPLFAPNGSGEMLRIRVHCALGPDVYETYYFYRFGGSASSIADLGRVWSVFEAGEWIGTWTRRGDTNIIDAVWTNKNTPGEWRDEMTIESVRGDQVVLFRKGMNGRYTGTISADRKSISGTASWYQPGQNWTAQIR